MNGALSKEIENGSKMSKNTSLSYGVIFFWRKKEWMGVGISGGGTWGPQGQGRALHPCGQLVRPPGVFFAPEILKYCKNNHTKFSGHLENFYFRDIFYCMDNSENR